VRLGFLNLGQREKSLHERGISMQTLISSTTRRDFIKTLAIGAGGCAFGPFLIHSEMAFAQSTEENLEKIPMATRWAVTSKWYLHYKISDDMVLFEKVGQEEFNKIRKESGLKVGAWHKKSAADFGFTGNDAKSVAAMAAALVTMYYGPDEKFEIVDATAEKATVKCINCAYWNAAQARKIAGDTCSAWSQYWWEGFATAMNPNLTLNLVKARPLGDSICQWEMGLKT
jgi:hypothetical protein